MARREATFTFALAESGSRDMLQVILPRPLHRKAYDALAAAVNRACSKTLTGRKRRPRKR